MKQREKEVKKNNLEGKDTSRNRRKLLPPKRVSIIDIFWVVRDDFTLINLRSRCHEKKQGKQEGVSQIKNTIAPWGNNQTSPEYETVYKNVNICQTGMSFKKRYMWEGWGKNGGHCFIRLKDSEEA